jgi:histone acetyltransferase (RNA polymerase elongator complex component)
MAYSTKPFIIPIFIPHAGCPHRCVFCNQTSITGVHSTPSGKDIRDQIESFLKFKNERRSWVQIAFFGGNFLGVGGDEIMRLLKEAAAFVKNGRADSIRFSTRPDTIDPRRLKMIKNFPVATIELGVQSMNDGVLMHTNRGHTASDTVKAIQLLKKNNYQTGVQLMVGLPEDTPERSIDSAKQVAELKPDFIRIYPTVVLDRSPLATWYRKGAYVPLRLEAAVTLAKEMVLLFQKENIPVIRMGLQATGDLEEGAAILAGPYHPAFGHLVYSEVFLDMAVAALESESSVQEEATLRVHPCSISKMKGLKNRNIHVLKEKFALKSVEVIPDGSLGQEALAIG